MSLANFLISFSSSLARSIAFVMRSIWFAEIVTSGLRFEKAEAAILAVRVRLSATWPKVSFAVHLLASQAIRAPASTPWCRSLLLARASHVRETACSTPFPTRSKKLGRSLWRRSGVLPLGSGAGSGTAVVRRPWSGRIAPCRSVRAVPGQTPGSVPRTWVREVGTPLSLEWPDCGTTSGAPWAFAWAVLAPLPASDRATGTRPSARR